MLYCIGSYWILWIILSTDSIDCAILCCNADKLSSVAGHFEFWPCFAKKRCPANFNCLYKPFFLIFLSLVYLLIALKMDVMSRQLPNSYRINRTCPAKFETVQIFQKNDQFVSQFLPKKRELSWKTVWINIAKDDEWLWNNLTCKIWLTRAAISRRSCEIKNMYCSQLYTVYCKFIYW